MAGLAGMATLWGVVASGCGRDDNLTAGPSHGGGGAAVEQTGGAPAWGGRPGSNGTGGTGGFGGRIAVPGTGVGGAAAGTGTVSCAGTSAVGGRSPGGRSNTLPSFLNLETAVQPPPPVSGGTLIVLRNGRTAVAADPDRDLVYVVDVADPMNPRLQATVVLTPGDEPGRLAEDGAGQVHVVLRKGGALATIDPVAATVTLRRPICLLPRGLAYQDATDRLHVACAGGDFITLAPRATTPERTMKLAPDLRDVIVDGARLMVTRFRSAEVLVVDGNLGIVERLAPSSMQSPVVHKGVPFEPAVAWRAVPMPGGGAAMVHQRGMKGVIDRTPGGYGGPPCDTIVHTAVSVMKSGQAPAAGPAIPGFPLPVDMALSPDGKTVALIAAGNGRSSVVGAAPKLFVTKVDDVAQSWSGGCGTDGVHGPRSCFGASTVTGGRSGTTGGTGGVGGTAGSGGASGAAASGGRTGTAFDAGVAANPNAGCRDLPPFVEPTAVAFVGAATVLVQTRQPAQLWVVKQPAGDATVPAAPLAEPFSISLSPESRADLGHAVFHSNSGAGLACASCHPEGHEDGFVWSFQCEGERRTQDISGGISGTEPFHWKGDQADFATLVKTVFVGRMAGPVLSNEQMAAALSWINTIPARPALRGANDIQVVRGRALFHDPVVACATCHSGSQLTNNTTVSVTTAVGGEPFQVPSLRGVAWRGPYMHDGCAPDLGSRLSSAACGGDTHGKTSHLLPDQLADLVAFLESL